MAVINQTTTFSIGDKVWHKTTLDNFIDSDATAGTDYWIYLIVPTLLYKITKVIVRLNSDSTTTILYNAELFMTQATENSIKGVAITQSIENIEEANFYGYSEGKTKINTKISDFQTYLDTLDTL